MPRHVLLLLLVTTSFVPQLRADDSVGQDSPEGPSAADLGKWVEQLGDDDFFVREAATRQLWEAGPEAARTALERAVTNGDSEVVYRAKQILWNFDHGILVGTPPEVVKLVDRFQSNNDSVKREVVRDLARLGHIRTLTALLRNATNRGVLAQQVSGEVGRVLPKLLAGDRHAETLEWLDLAATVAGEPAVRNRNSFLLVHGGLADRITRVEEAIDPANPSKAQSRELVELNLVAGNLEEAGRHAELADDGQLEREIALRVGNWSKLTTDELLPGDAGVEQMGFRAVFARLAEDEAALEAAVAELKKHAAERADRRWMCAEALLLAERIDDAADAFAGDTSSLAAFELDCARGRHREAFARLGIGLKPDGPEESRTAEQWFDGEVEAANGDPNKLQAAVARGIVVLREVVRLQGRAGGAKLLARIRRVAENPDVNRQYSVVQIADELGDRKVAHDVAAEALLKLPDDGDPRILGPLFDDRETTAFVLWKWRRRQVVDERIDESAAESLGWTADVLAGRPFNGDFEALCELLVAYGQRQQDPAKKLQWIRAAADAACDRGEYALALECLEPAVEGSATSTQLLFAGDVAAKAEDWSAAATFYERAAEGNRADVLAPMLQGLALERAGDAERADVLVRRARLLPLGNVGVRGSRASELIDRGFADEAKREWETVLRLGTQSSFEGSSAWAVQLTFARFGNAISDDDPLRAADFWQRYLLHFAKTNSAYTEVRRYLAVAHLSHRVRARGLVEAGRIEDAVAEARRAHAIWPGNIELALRLVPQLDETGHAKEADAIFDLVHEAALGRAKDFPENPGGHNDLAWLNAKCGRRLDEALEHSEKAVAAEPDSVAYLDTLAEIHFQRGDREKAIELAERCVAMDPLGEHYRDQLKRFRGK